MIFLKRQNLFQKCSFSVESKVIIRNYPLSINFFPETTNYRNYWFLSWVWMTTKNKQMIEITIQLWKCSFSGKISMYSTNKSLGLLVYIFLTNNVTSLIINQLQWLSISLFASILLWKRTTNISLEPMKYFWPG